MLLAFAELSRFSSTRKLCIARKAFNCAAARKLNGLIAMHPSFLLRLFFSHALLSSLQLLRAGGNTGHLARASSSSSASTERGHVSSSSISDDDLHEEIHHVAGTQFRQLNPSNGGFVSDWNRDWFQTGGGGFGGRISQGKCIDIPSNMTLCQGIGYSQMRLPNLLEHDSVKEATQQAGSWIPLLNIRCHPDTQVFLCSLFAPVCLDRPIWPCKSLCEAVKVGCEGRMSKYGFPWPEMLRCEKFPPDNDLCIGMRQDNQSDETLCPACNQPETFENIIDNFCSADFALRVKLEDVIVSDSDMKLAAGKKKKAFKRGTLKSKELRDMTFYIENGAQCKCRVTEELMSDPKRSGHYLVMGSNKNDRLFLTFIERMDRESPDMTKALDQIRKGKICKAGFQMITYDEMKKNNGKTKGKLGEKKDGQKSDEIKGNGKNTNGIKADGKKVDGLKEYEKKADGRKGADKKGDGGKADTRKGEGKNNAKKTENGKRSADSKPDKTGSRKRQKEAKSRSMKSSN